MTSDQNQQQDLAEEEIEHGDNSFVIYFGIYDVP